MQKVLIIAYYWPPAGGPGVQRWLNFVKYLPDFGVEPIVYVPENPNYPIIDTSLLKDIPSGIRILKQPIFEPYKLAAVFSKKKTKRISSGIINKDKKQSFIERTMLWIRGNFFIPDARKYWVKPSISYLSKLIKEENIKTIISTGPPHSIHLIGLGLKAEYNLRWLADFRDPWTSIGYHNKLKLTKTAQQKHKQLEKQVLNTADSIIVTSKTTKQEFTQITSQPITVITNGYDKEIKKAELDKKFTISHIGSLLTDRNPQNLWRVLQELIAEKEGFAEQLQIQLVGVVGKEVLDAIENYGLNSYTNSMGYISHEKVLQVQPKSQVLLLLEIDTEETKGILPGKLFEYLNARRPILAIGPKDWEAATIVKETNSGVGVESTNLSALKNVLLEWFTAYQKGNLTLNATSSIEKYSRKELTKELAKSITWE